MRRGEEQRPPYKKPRSEAPNDPSTDTPPVVAAPPVSRFGPESWFPPIAAKATAEGQTSDCNCRPEEASLRLPSRALPGEHFIPECNFENLYPYRVAIEPPLPFPADFIPTTLIHDGNPYVFHSFHLLSHTPPPATLPTTTISRDGREHVVSLVAAPLAERWTDGTVQLAAIDWLHIFVFRDLLDMHNFLPYTKGHPTESDKAREPGHRRGCRRYIFSYSIHTLLPSFHIFPRFLRADMYGIARTHLPSLLPPTAVMKAIRSIQYRAGDAIVSATNRPERERDENQGELVPFLRGQVVLCKYRTKGPPTAYRVDDVIWLPDVDRQQVWEPEKKDWMPMYAIFGAQGQAVHMMVHSVALGSERSEPVAWAGPANKKERQRVLMPAQHSVFSGVRFDLCHYATLLPALVLELRYLSAFEILEMRIGTTFMNKQLLKRAFMQSGVSETYGGYDELKIAMSRVAIPSLRNERSPETPAKRHLTHTELMELMDKPPVEDPDVVQQDHYERLEFLGDAVVQFAITIGLYHAFPNEPEGYLSQARSALVSNVVQAHWCHELDLNAYFFRSRPVNGEKKYLADMFEALVGALFQDQGLASCKQFIAKCLFHLRAEASVMSVWLTEEKTPLEKDETAREVLLQAFPLVQHYERLEQTLGVKFRNLKLLLQAFTHPSLTNYQTQDSGVKGPDGESLSIAVPSNGRLEFLGDAVLQFMTTRYVYRHFPEHQEQHLSALRAALVNNKVLAEIGNKFHLADMVRHIMPPGGDTQRTTDMMTADAFEALLGAMYLDQGLEAVEDWAAKHIWSVTLETIEGRQWIDPRQRLKRSLQEVKGSNVAPVYKLVREYGPAHNKTFTVALEIMGRQVSEGSGDTKMAAEQIAAKKALDKLEIDIFAKDTTAKPY